MVKSTVFIAHPVKVGDRVGIAMGSGSLIDADKRLVLTNYHVVAGSSYVAVQFPEYLKDGSIQTDKAKYLDRVKAGQTLRGKVLFSDQGRDLAIVQVNQVPASTPAIPLAKKSVSVGATTWNIGSPGAVSQVFSITEGKVRGVGDERFLVGGETPESVFEVRAKMITTTNPTNGGDSGGPLYDKNGELVGVTQSGSKSAQAVNHFVDVTEVRALLDEKKIVLRDPAPATDPKGGTPVARKETPVSAPIGEDAQQLYERVVQSCVFIVTPGRGGHGEGSGTLIDAEKRLVLTNFHVVDEEKFVYCQFPIYQKDGSIMTDKKKYVDRVPAGLATKGEVLYRDKSRDLAIVQLAKLDAGIPALPLAKKSVSVGATTWNIGSPGAVRQVFSVTEGKVRAVGIEKFLVGDGSGSKIFEIRAKMVTTTNPANPGDSGGPLFNNRGEMVGVTQSVDTEAQQVNHFVDVTEVLAFLGEKKIQLSDPGDPKLKTPVPKKGPVEVKPKDNGTGPPMKDPAVTPTPKVDPPAAGPSAADETAAGNMLRRAKLFADGEDNRPTYIAKLNEIIKKYPGTAAAKEAKKLLDGLK
jgi:S1-C subfamily serine protease